ncbi:MAG TPA: alpha/beta hydrolase-fold protein [Vicinamibacterales bacterium]|nr:alpha/beta hydrolase-fold protein [Vicinamibacterales bacterium]
MTRLLSGVMAIFLVAGGLRGLPAGAASAQARATMVVRLGSEVGGGPFDGRLLLLISKNSTGEPRLQVSQTSYASAQVFGIDVEGMKPGDERTLDAAVLGYPLESLSDLPAGEYVVQGLLHKYETFRLATGHTVKLPMDRGEGQQWNLAPGNVYSAPQKVRWDGGRGATVRLELDQVIPPIKEPEDTRYVKHLRIRSELLSKFWGREMFLGAHVLLPEGFDTHPEARYPLVINHGHFPSDFGGWRETPPDPDLKCEYSQRFRLDCYNRIQQQAAYDFYKEWTGPDFPRVLAIEIQHANPYYDDSYAVNSANLGPYGDAIMKELVPEIEKRFRGIGAGWARATYGGSTGGWEALAAQMFYPDEFNAAYAACPDPIDFRAFTLVNIYEDANAYWSEGPFMKVPRPGHRDYLGQVSATIEQMNRLELVLGTKTRSGQQWDIWEAVYSPQGSDGYPVRIWDKRTGVIDRKVAEYWKEHYDLSWILRRDWNKGLGRKLEGKIHLYVGDMDNYYLNNAVYLVEDFLETTRDPHYGGEVAYGDRAEHCWNGDPTRANAYSRLRYHQMFIPKFVERALKTAPAGADVKSWRY